MRFIVLCWHNFDMKIFLGVFFSFCICANVFAQVWVGNNTISELSGDENLIESGAVLNPVSGTNISVIDSTSIINYGTINAGLFADDNTLIQIYNYGDVSGQIIAPRVIQVMTPDVVFGGLDIQTSDYTIAINNFSDGVNLNDIQSLNPNHVRFRNSRIIVDDISNWQDWNVDIDWSGINTLSINASEDIVSGINLNHLPDYGIIVEVLDNDGFNKPYIDYTGQDPTVNIVSETDYDRLFNDVQGAMLQDIQNTNPNDKLLLVMNGAHDINELRDIMNSSYRFNADILMRPIVALDNFAMMDALFWDTGIGGGVVPVYVGSKYMNNRGVYLYGNVVDNEKSALRFNLRLNKFNYEDNLNVFSGISYGADVNGMHKIDNFIVKGYFGFNLVDFTADHIYVDGDVKNNPFGYSLYGGMDGFYNYVISENIYLTPFVGWNIHNYNILNDNDLTLNLRAGTAVKYGFTIDGIKYEYGLYGGAVSNGDLFGVARIGFDSVIDRVGVAISVGMFKDNFAMNYRAMFDVKFSF